MKKSKFSEQKTAKAVREGKFAGPHSAIGNKVPIKLDFPARRPTDEVGISQPTWSNIGGKAK